MIKMNANSCQKLFSSSGTICNFRGILMKTVAVIWKLLPLFQDPSSSLTQLIILVGYFIARGVDS